MAWQSVLPRKIGKLSNDYADCRLLRAFPSTAVLLLNLALEVWKSVWLLISAPFTAIFMGRLFGVPVTRNPLRWLALLIIGLLLIPFIFLVYPAILILMYVSYCFAFRKGQDARITVEGLTVFSRSRGDISFHPWSEVAKMRRCFAPPITYPQLVLRTGEVIDLESVRTEVLVAALQQRNIPVDLTSGDHDL